MAENMVAEEKQTLVSKKDLVKAWWRWTTAVEVLLVLTVCKH